MNTNDISILNHRLSSKPSTLCTYEIKHRQVEFVEQINEVNKIFQSAAVAAGEPSPTTKEASEYITPTKTVEIVDNNVGSSPRSAMSLEAATMLAMSCRTSPGTPTGCPEEHRGSKENTTVDDDNMGNKEYRALMPTTTRPTRESVVQRVYNHIIEERKKEPESQYIPRSHHQDDM